MWTALAVFDPPGLDQPLRLGDGFGPVDIQAFVAQRPIEGLDKRVVGRFSGVTSVVFVSAQKPKGFHSPFRRHKFEAVARGTNTPIESSAISSHKKYRWIAKTCPQVWPADACQPIPELFN